MSQFQVLIEILLLALIIFMGMAIVRFSIRIPKKSHTNPVHSLPRLVTMPNNVHERGDYLLALIKEGHFMVEMKTGTYKTKHERKSLNDTLGNTSK